MTTMPSSPMTLIERRAVFSLAGIMSLRMIGLFMVLPLFSLYASTLQGATATLIGIAMGIYGLTQALFQIPFGALSDRIGRKCIITTGLAIFVIGSLIAGFAHTITGMIIGRALQGMGAIGGTTLAMMADLTRDHHRTKAMAIAGITIGFSFSIAMLIGPVLLTWLPTHDVFFVSAVLGLLAIVVLHTLTPTPEHSHWHGDAEPARHTMLSLLLDQSLFALNSGIFILHAIFTASFIVFPISLHHYFGLTSSMQWKVYLPTLLAGFVATLVLIRLAEKSQQLKLFFIVGIVMLLIAMIALWLSPAHWLMTHVALFLFFTGFSLLEAFLPSLVSRTAPAHRKGSAMGIFSCLQFLGIFAGGAMGGWLYGHYHFLGVYSFCVILLVLWLALANRMSFPALLHR